MKYTVSSLIIALVLLLEIPLLAASKGTVFVTGANRGMGFEYAKQYKAKGYTVIATARKPETAEKLNALGVRVIQLDVTDPESVASMAQAVGDTPIDILINNAGYFDRADVTLDKIDFDTFARTMNINTMGPLRVTQALIDNVLSSNEKKVINMSSGLGSISNSNGRWYAYRSSKTALNQINKILSEEYKTKGAIFAVVHPGWVRTDMGGVNATYSPQESISSLINEIAKLTAKDSGRFFDLKGREIDW